MTIRAAVLGMPVSHSLSPVLHGYWLKHYGIDGSYERLATPPAALKLALERIIDQGYAGCNLTIPHKEPALELMDELHESCIASGAVNTVLFHKGKMKGFNSDGFGFVESLKAQVPDWSRDKVVILGTGGAARGIIASLRDEGVKNFVLINRTQEKAEKVVADLKIKAAVGEWKHRSMALKDASLLVNCTSLGMDGEGTLDIDLAALPTTATVADIVYRPLETRLLAAARRRNNKIVEGLSMLLHQGRLGFGLWYGKDPEVTPELHKTLREIAT